MSVEGFSDADRQEMKLSFDSFQVTTSAWDQQSSLGVVRTKLSLLYLAVKQSIWQQQWLYNNMFC